MDSAGQQMDLNGVSCFIPARACDCHTHVFGPPERYPYDAGRKYTPGLASVEDMDARHQALGVQRVVVVQPSPYGSDNRCTLDAVIQKNEGGADAARAVVVIDDTVNGIDLQRMHNAGVRGVRINLETHHVDDATTYQMALMNTARRIASLGWHIQIYASLRVITQLADVVAGLPVQVVFDHFAGLRGEQGLDQTGFSVLCDLLAHGNVYIKLSAQQRASASPGFADLKPLVTQLASLRADRLLWGSDWPHPAAWPGVPRDPAHIEPFHPVDDAQALANIVHWLRSPERVQAVLVDNPARLYGWG